MGDPIPVPAAPGNTNQVNAPTRTFNEIKTVSLEFIGDHAMLKDNATDWTNTGNAFPKPEFTYGKQSAPISRTKDNVLAVKVGLEVWPADAPQMPCTITGATTWGLSFTTKFPLQGGQQVVILESAEKLPNRVTKLAGDIEWTVDNGADGPMKADHSWGHENLRDDGRAGGPHGDEGSGDHGDAHEQGRGARGRRRVARPARHRGRADEPRAGLHDRSGSPAA